MEIKKAKKLHAHLKEDRNSFEEYWKEVAKYVEPRRGYFEEDIRQDLGKRKDKDMINNRILQAKRVAISGLYSGTVSSSRPWFKLETTDKKMMRVGAIRQWLFDCEEVIRRILFTSNFYPSAVTAIDELITFSTASMGHFDDDETIAHFKTPTIGRYYCLVDSKGNVVKYVLEQDMSAEELEERFGRERLTAAAQQALANSTATKKFKIIQIVEKNKDYDPDRLESEYKRYSSVIYQQDQTLDLMLEEKGFDEMPFYVMRWEVVADESYGYGAPGMVALGDHKGLQEEEKEKAIAIKTMSRPLLKGPATLKNFKVPQQQGIVAFDQFGANNTSLSPVYQTDPRIAELRQDMAAVETRINEAFFVDLFQSISSLQGVQPRNELEISQRNQESLTVLGPVLERFERDFMSKVLSRVFRQAFEAGELPEAPEELQDQVLDIRFISVLAQAQKSAEVSALERYIQFGQAVAQFKPGALDKVDEDAAMELYGQLTGVNPSIVPDEETVAEIRNQRAEAAAKQQEAEQNALQATANSQNAAALQQVTAATGGQE